MYTQLFSSGQHWELSYRSPYPWSGKEATGISTQRSALDLRGTEHVFPYSFSTIMLPGQTAHLEPCRLTLTAAQSTVAYYSSPCYDAELVHDGS